jgi:anti-sigma factor RsiW
MTCRDAIAVLADYLDQALAADALAELERHLADCAPCRAYLATYDKTRVIGAEAQQVAMPEEMKTRLRRFLLDRLERP